MTSDEVKKWVQTEFNGRYSKAEQAKIGNMAGKDWNEALSNFDYESARLAIKSFFDVSRWTPNLAEFEAKAKEFAAKSKQHARPAEDKDAVKEWVVNCRGVFHEKPLRNGRMPSDNEISEAFNRIYHNGKTGDLGWHVVSKTFTQMCINRSKFNVSVKAVTPTNIDIKRDSAFSEAVCVPVADVTPVTELSDTGFFEAEQALLTDEEYENLI